MANEWLEKMRSIGTVSRRPQVREGRDADGARWKATRDEAGNVVTERAGDRQDVTINAPRIVAHTAVREERN